MAKKKSTLNAKAYDGHRGIMMILSPSKTMDTSDLPYTDLPLTMPDCSPELTRRVAEAVQSRTTSSQLEKLLSISKNLAQTAMKYWKDFIVDSDDETSEPSIGKPSLFTFTGAVFQGVLDGCEDPTDPATLSYWQDNLRIVDPVYGILRPLDVMQPYRLEMRTQNVLTDEPKVKLADLWQDAVTEHLSRDLAATEGTRILLNLASDEYAAAVNAQGLPENVQYVKAIFWDQGRVVTIYTKRARGLMARFLAENQVDTLEGIQAFNLEGYSFVPDKSDETTVVFDRKSLPPKKKKKSTASASSRKRTSKATDSKPKAAKKKSKR